MAFVRSGPCCAGEGVIHNGCRRKRTMGGVLAQAAFRCDAQAHLTTGRVLGGGGRLHKARCGWRPPRSPDGGGGNRASAREGALAARRFHEAPSPVASTVGAGADFHEPIWPSSARSARDPQSQLRRQCGGGVRNTVSTFGRYELRTHLRQQAPASETASHESPGQQRTLSGGCSSAPPAK